MVLHVEAWRLFTSGQFMHRRVLVTDLVDSPELTAFDLAATGAVAVWDVLLYLVEVAELAARYVTAFDCEAITFQVALDGVAGASSSQATGGVSCTVRTWSRLIGWS